MVEGIGMNGAAKGLITIVEGADDGATRGDLQAMAIKKLGVHVVPLFYARRHDGR
jgi:hypothetical protein